MINICLLPKWVMGSLVKMHKHQKQIPHLFLGTVFNMIHTLEFFFFHIW